MRVAACAAHCTCAVAVIKLFSAQRPLTRLLCLLRGHISRRSHTASAARPSLPLDGLHGRHVEVRVPPAVQQEAEVVNLKQVARWTLILHARQSRELDDGRHVRLKKSPRKRYASCSKFQRTNRDKNFS